MHKDLVKEGLVVITLSVDELENKKAALDFLVKNKAEFQNFLLEDSDANKEKWEKKLEHTAPPYLHVFDRSGKKVKTFDGDAKQEDEDKFIQELLKAK